jgi:hypothetical protein
VKAKFEYTGPAAANADPGFASAMSLPPALRASVTPPELELIACQQLVEIIPLISMERTAFIAVHHLLALTCSTR